MFKKIAYLISIIFLLNSCADTFKSVKRGLTGAKKESSDEFLVQKKAPLTLPPDFENLPTPDERSEAEEELKIFKGILEASEEETSSESSSAENSILKKIQSK